MASVYREKGKHTWSVAWTDSQRKRHVVRGLPTKAMAEEVGSNRDFHKHAAKHRLIDPALERYDREAGKPIDTHLADFKKKLESLGKTEKYIYETVEFVRRMFKQAGIERIDRIDREDVHAAAAALPAGRKVIGGRLSYRSRNKALTACKRFCNWLVDAKRIAVNPLNKLKGWDAEQDRRRVRSILTDHQVLDLIESTAEQKTRGGMTGIDRMMRYAIGIGTGFRQGTLFSLTPESFHLDSVTPFIHVEARDNKGRKALDHQISHELADMIRPWLAEKPKKKPVFPKMPTADPMHAYRRDLKAAGILYHDKDTVIFCDQHAHRGTFITSIIRTAGLKVAQDLAHHSTPVLTSKYGQMGIDDYAKALAGLPKMKKIATRGKNQKAG